MTDEALVSISEIVQKNVIFCLVISTEMATVEIPKQPRHCGHKKIEIVVGVLGLVEEGIWEAGKRWEFLLY